MHRMRPLRYISLVALAIWVGGLVTLGVLVAPTVFVLVEAQQIQDGRALAATLFAAFLDRFHTVAYGAGAAVMASLLGRRLIGPRPICFGTRITLLTVMLAAMLYSGLVLAEQIERIQQDVGVPSLTLPEDHPTRVEFSRLHDLSVVLMGVNVIGGLALLGWEAYEHG